MASNFVELKGSVFKKFDPENLFQIACSDIVERFRLIVYVGVVSATWIYGSTSRVPQS